MSNEKKRNWRLDEKVGNHWKCIRFFSICLVRERNKEDNRWTDKEKKERENEGISLIGRRRSYRLGRRSDENDVPSYGFADTDNGKAVPVTTLLQRWRDS